MCGIAGYLHRDGREASSVSVDKMVEAFKHRGPDAQSSYCFQNLALGHARLSIIDLSVGANQPMHTPDHRYTIVYNGEVYNFKEIRSELHEKGHHFLTKSDTEVILRSYIEWGSACVERFNGMFAFVLLDKLKKELFFARDRYGIKPLYYGEFNGTFIFGSEIKAIETHPDYRFEVNKEGLREYFSFQNFLSNQTLNKGVELFPAGHTAIMKLDGSSNLTLQQYWDFQFEEPTESMSVEECGDELASLFQKAVKRQLVSDVALGSYLSGGMDSGSITAVSASQIENMHTFTCGFDMSSASGGELDFDERGNARSFADHFGTRHHEKIIGHDDMEAAIPRIAWHLEEPRVGQSYPNYYAAELARSKVTVVLSGAGGDELFAGYPWRYYRAIENTHKNEYLDKYFRYWQRLVPQDTHEQFFEPIWADVKDYSVRDEFDSVYSDSLDAAKSPADYVNQSLYFEAKTFMHGLLVLEDKLSMAHSLESRVPMLDNDLVDFAMKIPADFKLASLAKVAELSKLKDQDGVNSYCQRSKDGKLILRKAMERYLPEDTSKREKQGFSGPDASWFKNESAQYIQDVLYNRNASMYGLINYDSVSSTLDSHFAGNINARLLIWSLLSFDSWLTQHGLSD